MSNLLRNYLVLFLPAVLISCGGGSGTNTSMAGTLISNTPASGPITLAAGATFTMPVNTHVLVPAGTSVMSPTSTPVELVGIGSSSGDGATLLGKGATLVTGAGAVVTVPANATGPANSLVTTDQGVTTASNPALNVTVLAGSSTSTMRPADGTYTSAILWGGGKLSMDLNRNIIFSDYGELKKLTQAGQVTTLSRFDQITWDGVAIDNAGNIYGSGPSVNLVSTSPPTWGASIAVLSAAGPLQTIARNWQTSTSTAEIGFGGLVFDSHGNLFLADFPNNRIVRFTAKGDWSVFAGNGASGNADGLGTAATFAMDDNSNLAIDVGDNIYINSGGVIRKIAPDGTVTTVIAGLKSLSNAIALDPSGNFYVAGYQTIYRVGTNLTVMPLSFPNTADFITSMTADSQGNLYLGTRGRGAQIFRISF